MLKKSLPRSAILLRWQVRDRLPSFRYPAPLGSPGQTVPGLPVRRGRASPGPSPLSGSPVASPLSGIIHALRSPCFAMAPAQAIRGLGVRRGDGPPDPHLLPPHPLELQLIPLRPWSFSARKAKARFLLYCIFQTLWCLKNVRRLSATAPALLYLPTSDRQGWWKCKGL